MIVMIIEKGRPGNAAGRLEKEIRVYDLLDRLGIEYDRADHPVADTMEDCQEISQALHVDICKNLFLCNRQHTQFYLLLIPDGKKFLTKELSKQIGSSRLSFAEAEYMERLLDITPGSVSIMGLMNDMENQVRLLVDEDLLQEEYLGCHPCINTSSIRLKTKDVLETFLTAIHHNMTTVHLEGDKGA